MTGVFTVILSGGKSRRMGRDKAELEYNGMSFLEFAVKRYSHLGVTAVSADRHGRFDTFGAAELTDLIPGGGPLNGICSAFMYTEEREIFLTAVDLPLAVPEAAVKIMSLLGEYDACVPEADGHFVPLFAAYSRRCLTAALDCLQNGSRSFRELFNRISVRFVSPDELAPYWKDGMLANINTPEDYIKNIKSK